MTIQKLVPTMRTAMLGSAAVLATALVGCAGSTDGTPQPRASTVTVTASAAPSAADPFDSAGPTAEGSVGPANPASIDPCSVVTKDEADQLAGTTLQPAQRAEQLCTFATPTSGSVGQLEVYVGDGAKKYFDIDKINLGHPFHRVPGVGDEAWEEDGAIFFSHGGIWFGLRLLRLDDVDTGPALARLASRVVGRA
jgi:hypothetical protein